MKKVFKDFETTMQELHSALQEQKIIVYAEVITRNVKDEIKKTLNDKETEIKVDKKSLQSVNQAIRNLIGSIGKR